MKEISMLAILGFVFGWLGMVVYRERRLRKEAEIELLYRKWQLCCEKLLLWKLKNIHQKEDRYNDRTRLSWWCEQQRLAMEYRAKGGAKNVDFDQVRGGEWELYSPSDYVDDDVDSKILKSITNKKE